jgi:hypothetical protein
MTATSSLLRFDDNCRRAGWRSLRLPAGPLGVLPILREAVDIGLAAEDDRGERAAMAVRDAALNGRLQVSSPETLYVISEHLAAVAEQIVYVVGGDNPWSRPDPVWLDAGLAWEPGVFLGEGGLRRVVLGSYRDEAERMSWHEQGEQAVYGGALTEIVVSLGALREGRFHGHWSKGWKHPRSKEIRLADSLGGEFRTWNLIWRESERIDVKEWTALMNPHMAKCLSITEREPLPDAERKRWRYLAVRKLTEMQQPDEPAPQISQCRQCPYGPCGV